MGMEQLGAEGRWVCPPRAARGLPLVAACGHHWVYLESITWGKNSDFCASGFELHLESLFLCVCVHTPVCVEVRGQLQQPGLAFHPVRTGA